MAEKNENQEIKVIDTSESIVAPQSDSTYQNSSFSSFRENVMEKIPVVLPSQEWVVNFSRDKLVL